MAPDRKFPGDFASAIMVRVNPDGTVEICVVGVVEKERMDQLKAEGKSVGIDDMKIKLPGGCADTADQTPSEVLANEIRKECFEGHSVLGTTLLVHENHKPNKDARSLSKEHVQRFFLIQRWEGDMRVGRDVLEDEGDEYLTPPVFVEFRSLYPIIFGTHQVPLFKAIEALARENSHIAGQYADILSDFRNGRFKRTYSPRK